MQGGKKQRGSQKWLLSTPTLCQGPLSLFPLLPHFLSHFFYGSRVVPTLKCTRIVHLLHVGNMCGKGAKYY